MLIGGEWFAARSGKTIPVENPGQRQIIATVPRGTSVSEAALVGLSSMTHSFDMNQRYVQVRLMGPLFTRCTDPSTCEDMYVIQAPAAAETAPPGYYMLFIQDANRVPSVAKILQVTAPQAGVQCFESNCLTRKH